MKKDDFIGINALKKELDRGPKWEFVGIEIKWSELENHYRNAGLAPGLPSTAWRSSTPLYYNSEQVGYATSGTWSPILKRYIALAHLKSEYSQNGTELEFEIKVEHFKKTTKAQVVNTPFFNPERKRSCPV
jgi:aminomethyltransferase